MKISLRFFTVLAVLIVSSNGVFAQDSASDTAGKVGGWLKGFASSVVNDLTTAPAAGAVKSSGSGNPTIEVGPQSQGPIVYSGTLRAFSDERNKNPLRFGDKYKSLDKVVVLSGYMMDVSDHEGRSTENGGNTGRPFSALRFLASPGRQEGPSNPLGMCYAEDPATRQKIRELDRDQKVTVRAIYQWSDFRSDIYFDLNECVIVSVGK